MKGNKSEEPEIDDPVIEGQEEEDDQLAAKKGTVEVDISEKKEEKKDERKADPELEKTQKRMEYQTRQVEKVLKQMSELTAVVQSLKAEKKPDPEKIEQAEEELDDVDKIAQKDWKQAVRMLGEEAAKKVYRDLLLNQQENLRKQKLLSTLESSKSRVLEKWGPEIDDENSDLGKMYLETVNELGAEDSDFFRNPRGPEIAAARLREKFEDMGQVPPSSKPVVDREVQRRIRTGGTQIPAGRSVKGQDNKIVLTKEQEQVARNGGIPLETYAKVVQALSRNGSVEAS